MQADASRCLHGRPWVPLEVTRCCLCSAERSRSRGCWVCLRAPFSDRAGGAFPRQSITILVSALPAACHLARCATCPAVTVNLGPGCSPSAGCWALGRLGPGGRAAAGKKAIGQAEHISTGSVIAEVLQPSTALIVSSNAMGIKRGGSQAATCLLGVCLPRHLTVGGFSGL